MAKKVEVPEAPEVLDGANEVNTGAASEGTGTNDTTANDAPETDQKPEVIEPAAKQPEVKTPVVKEAVAKQAVTKKVNIHTTDEVDCYIGGINYKFAKNKDLEVPGDVAAILVNGKKAYRN